LKNRNAQLIQNSITSDHQNAERLEKKSDKEKKGKIIAHMTERKRRQNLAKCCSVSLQS